MTARFLRPRRPLRSPSRTRVLRSELLEPRALLSGGGLLSSFARTPMPMVGAAKAVAAVNTAPTVAQAVRLATNGPVTGQTASLSVLGRDNGGETKLVYRWSVTAAPQGGTATFNLNNVNAAKNVTATFTKAGTYRLTATIIDAGGLSVQSFQTVTVASTFTRIGLATANGQAVLPSSTLTVSSVSQGFIARRLDQFGAVLTDSSAFTWSTTSLPLNSSAPRFATAGSVTTATFGSAGSYVLLVRAANAPNITCTAKVLVNQKLTSIVVSPDRPSVLQGAAQQFTAQALDQFRRVMANQQSITWSATAGTITASGLFTAPLVGTSCTVTAASGSVRGTATVSLVANPGGGGQTTDLASLVQSLDADGSINRADMIQILRSVGGDGIVDTTEFTGLKTILSQAATLNIPEYVLVLANDVVNGNLANATYQGQALGNLAAGSSAAQLNKLIDKWFLGADHPTLCNTSLSYRTVAGSLFARTPSHLDEVQGMLGDCYFISALGTLADSNPNAVRNMFIDNGDGTFTVRFYTGAYGTIYNYADGSISAGFRDNRGTADYVTVDRMLPTSSSGMLVYANYGANYANTANTLWIPLAEKAYAQWNETGKEGRDGLNAYASIQGGWMATVDAQVLGYNAIDYIMTRTGKQVAINALAAHKAVTIGTGQWSGTVYGLYANHAYAIVGYNAATDKFTLYNPWGSDQPELLTWSQLQATTTQMAVCDTSGTTPIVAASARAAVSGTLSAGRASDAALMECLPNDVVGATHCDLSAPMVDVAFTTADGWRG